MVSLVASLKIGSIVAVFFIILGCCLLPLKIFRRKKKDATPRFKRILALSNCLAGGIFLGTCFVGLMPMVISKFREACDVGEIDIHYPVAETTVVLGFFMILIIEQIVHSVQGGKKEKQQDVHIELNTLPTTEDYGYTASDEDSDDSEGELLANSDPEKQLLSKKKEKKAKKKIKRGVSDHSTHNGYDGHGHRHGNEGHGHSHEHHGGHNQGKDGHGHSHEHHGGHSHLSGVLEEESSVRCLILLLALAMHSVFEGMAMGLQEGVKVYVNLFIAVIVHECLCAFALGMSLAQHTLKTGTVIKLSIFFSLTIPVGIAIGMGVDMFQGFGGLMASSVLQGLATGTFLYALFFEIVPCAMEGDGDHLLKALFLFIGYLVVALLAVFNN